MKRKRAARLGTLLAPLLLGLILAASVGSARAARRAGTQDASAAAAMRNAVPDTKLFLVSGAGQEADIFKFASDVDADQTGEIGRMNTMLQVRR